MEALLQGERIADYANRVKISINTANTQLKRVFAKTETNRQSDLMRLMFSDPIASIVAGRRAAAR
jgi:DNA-binding CsgD family transcriptional regulator